MATGKLLFRQVEKAIEAIERAADPSATIMQTASTRHRAVLGGARRARGPALRAARRRLRARRGPSAECRTIAPGLFIPDEYPPIERVVDEGVVVMDLERAGRGSGARAPARAPSASRRSPWGTTSTSCPSRSTPPRRRTTWWPRSASCASRSTRSCARTATSRPCRRRGGSRCRSCPSAPLRRGRDRDGRLHDAGGARRRRLLRLHPGVGPHPRPRHRRRLGARPAGGAPGARRLHRVCGWRSSATSRSCGPSSG